MPARRPEPKRAAPAPSAGALAFVSRNPAAVASGAMFAVTLGFVSANALWLQPHGHPSALFATRMAGEVATTQSDAAGTGVRPAPRPDAILQSVQASLQELGFHAGAVDGLDGPATQAAVAAFRREAGLDPSGGIDEALLAALDAALAGDEAEPSPEHTGEIARPEAAGSGPDLRKLQAGLRAFGNEEVTVDGVLGAKTRQGIRQFQAMFGLPETGEPDQAVFNKMREIGLTD